MTVPFRITGHTFSSANNIVVSITEEGVTGRGEAAGVFYLNETVEEMLQQVESIRDDLTRGMEREELQQRLPAGGARNAIDCALWDLEAKRCGQRAWELIGLSLKETVSFETVGLDAPDKMAAIARSLTSPNIKVKLNADDPLTRITAVRNARPDALIIVDANQGWNMNQLADLAPQFAALNIAMIEQPLPRNQDAELEGFDSPVVLCADESCIDTSEFRLAADRYNMINIKLDKTGGLTEALKLVQMAQASGVELMVGNMLGTSLAMAPGFVIAQFCRFVDLDGPLYLRSDRDHAMTYSRGLVSAPETKLWG
jgi:L-alanine-DL-glutamate epimerase-like enolase superfamily enzyme